MTRKDYEMIAAEFKDKLDYLYNLGFDSPAYHVEDLLHMLAHDLSRDNPRFDRLRFLKAAGSQHVGG